MSLILLMLSVHPSDERPMLILGHCPNIRRRLNLRERSEGKLPQSLDNLWILLRCDLEWRPLVNVMDAVLLPVGCSVAAMREEIVEDVQWRHKAKPCAAQLAEEELDE